jgi:Flp pilus assembly protein TadB
MERKLLQVAVWVAGLAGVGLGLTGVLFGTMYADLSGDVVLDSYVRFLKGALLAIGLIYWSCIPRIERHGDRISLVTFILVFGTLSRLLSVIGHGVPTLGIISNLIAGLILVPLLWLWQRRVARVAQRSAVA